MLRHSIVVYSAQVYTAKTPMPQRRTRFGAAVFNNQIWVVGGYDNVAGSGEHLMTVLCQISMITLII